MKSILISGGSGSFGQAFVERLLSMRRMLPGEIVKYDGDIRGYIPPISSGLDRIVIYSRGEHAQEEMAHRFKDERLRFFIGDVRDKDRLELAMRGVDTVVHAAALKIVPTAEYNPTECVATNITGAENVVKAALRTGVKRVIALSTDKAVNPINLYGASKLAAEKIFIAANSLSAGGCAFSVVRYGNVVGSRGSVIPLFKRLAATGKPLPITDLRMTRFWITMDQAIDLVIDAIGMSIPGVIYVPKIPSMKIVDLAEAIQPNIKPRVVGIRPGEKIHECLLTEDEARTTVNTENRYVIHTTPKDLGKLKDGFRYTSDGNDKWLTVEQLRGMI